MPKNEATGRPKRQAFTAAEIFKFHEEQYLKTFTTKQAKKKGKLPIQRREEQQREASGNEQSPSTALAPLRALSLDNSPPPADPSSEVPFRDTPDSSNTPSPSMWPAWNPRQCSPADISGANHLQSLTARVSAVESRVEQLSKVFGIRLEATEQRLKAAGL